MSAKKKFYSDPATRPAVPPPDAAGIPAELRACARWVPWRFELTADGKKWTKVPLSALSGVKADCNARKSHGTYAQALAWVEAGKADGVGFAFRGSGYVGLDLDDARDPHTGRLTEFARTVLPTFPTYAETSPSGTGIKLVGRGAFPFAGDRKDHKPPGVELFNGGFFTITGAALPGCPVAVADLQPVIDAHLAALLAPPAPDPDPPPPPPPTDLAAGFAPKVPTADEVEARVRSHPEGRALMNGDTGGHDGDHSRADLALASLIAFYARRDPDLVDAVFRGSRLVRAKWDEKHHGDGRTYGAMTVARAVAGKREAFDWDGTVRVAITGGSPAPPAAADPVPWPTMAPAAYHGLAGDFVRLVEPNTEADPVALLAQFLVMFGSAYGRRAWVKAERKPHYPNEFAVLVGRSAKGRKGTSEAWPADLMRTAAAEWATHCRTGKLASGEALVWALRDPIFGMEDGVPTCVDEGVSDKRLLVTEGEFSVILKIAAKDTNTLSDQLREAWDGNDLNNRSKGSPCAATAPHVSVIGHTTESDLRALLTENAMANGFANRFMLFAVRRSKELPFGGDVDAADWDALAALVRHRLGAGPAGEIGWEPDAAARWRDGGVYSRLSRDRFGLAGSLTARAEAHVLRLSLAYALLDGAGRIAPAHLDAALAVWAYAEATAYRLFGGLTGDPLADDLLKLMTAAPGGASRWDLHKGVGKNIAADRIEAALGVLAGRGLARKEVRKTGGRDAEVWVAVPK